MAKTRNRGNTTTIASRQVSSSSASAGGRQSKSSTSTAAAAVRRKQQKANNNTEQQVVVAVKRTRKNNSANKTNIVSSKGKVGRRNHISKGTSRLTSGKGRNCQTKPQQQHEEAETGDLEDADNDISQAKRLWLKDTSNADIAKKDFLEFTMKNMDVLRKTNLLSEQDYGKLSGQLQELILNPNPATHRPPVPDYLCCSISMELMKDPVITPCGMTYERASIEEHLRHNGYFDPVTRNSLIVANLVPNYGLKEAAQHFLIENPWALEDS